jgi:hypothetical protein
MPVNNEDRDGLEQVYELNRLFLHFLRSQAMSGEDCLGLPRVAIESLQSMPQEQLDDVAEFPRALFTLSLGPAATQDRVLPTDTTALRARHAVQLTILLSVWNCCRNRSYRARAFFGLSLEAVRRLRMTPLSELPEIAVNTDLVACAFADSGWLWERLLTATNEQSREQLKLVALQPAAASVPTGRRDKRPH